ncbi:MAG TPA: hypothetical protein VLL08_33115 [Kineosporiaceae bacterium]|nr:hypothetical protein [Kineosporiaceae bacterium]
MHGSEAVFVALGTIGFLVLVLNLLLGGFIEHGFEASHEVDFGHPAPTDLHGPSWLSVKVVAASMVGFGAFGYVSSSAGLPDLISWPVAAAGFFAVGAGAYFLILKPLAGQQYNSLMSSYNYVGQDAIVTLEITAGGIGQVTFQDRQGARVTQTATSRLGEAVIKGTQVKIVDIVQNGVVVHHNSLSD